MKGVRDLHPASIARLCGGARAGHTVVCLESVGSTNEAAALMASAGAPEGMVVVAARQTAGRGRKGREWYSSAGGSLLFSLVLRPARSGETLTALLALSALRALDGLCAGAMIKWPNDIWIGERKVAGILAESRGESVVLGMGIDVNDEAGSFPPDLEETAVSLRIVTGRKLDRGELLASLLGIFSDEYEIWERDGFGPMSFEMERRLLWKGSPVLLDAGAETVPGVLSGITANGYLRLETPEGERVYSSGDVSLRKGAER
jgi:BirA family biotin operon repressor/biotin-[acetyl-CoA-carboxylase] ligase